MRKRTRLPHPWLRKNSWTLWEWWVLATLIGGVVGMGIVGIASACSSTIGSVGAIALLHIVGALEGAAFGLTQWLVLRKYIKHVGWWIVATAIAAMIAWLIGLKVVVALMLISFDRKLIETIPFALPKTVFFLGVWIGAVMGFAQWLVLRAHVHKGITWVFANSLAWGLGLLIVLRGAALLKPGDFTPEAALIGIATGATMGAVVGAITGIALVWLLKPRLSRHY